MEVVFFYFLFALFPYKVSKSIIVSDLQLTFKQEKQ
jgi:hypothetical protein